MKKQKNGFDRDLLESEVVLRALSSNEGGGVTMTEPKRAITEMPNVDKDGFLLKGTGWTEEVAEILAQAELDGHLTEDHWMVVHYIREYYLTSGSVPPVRTVARHTGLSLRSLKELFPSGLYKGACRIAGIPASVTHLMYPAGF